jgi:hypothetical protein
MPEAAGAMEVRRGRTDARQGGPAMAAKHVPAAPASRETAHPVYRSCSWGHGWGRKGSTHRWGTFD